MPEKVAMDKRRVRSGLARYLRGRGWSYDTPYGGVRERVVRLLDQRHPWWDWGHRVMVIVGRYKGGNYDVPRPPDIWYRQSGSRLTRRGASRPVWTVVRSYDEYRKRREAGEHDWKSIRVENDGFELNMGYYPDGGFYGLSRSELPILLRFLVRWAVSEWFGIRRWLYYKALHAAVEQRIPFTCQATPPKDSGGYQHWHCQQKKRHSGVHRFRNYTWDRGQVVHDSVHQMSPNV